ncbi:MAG: hypothetical protein Q4G67_01015 [Actinomycetia bacterium]|nr:hypothetical protein [Actinomycetes bacterium]
MTLWRRHRLSLIGIPVALALAMLASGQRLQHLWDPWGPREPVSVTAAGWAELEAPVPEDSGYRTYPFEVRLKDGRESLMHSTHPGEELIPVDLVEGTRLYQVHLQFRADPNEPVIQCQVDLVDTEGAVYTPGLITPTFTESDINPCLRSDRPGPSRLGEEPTDAFGDPLPPRPTTWERYVSFVIPKDRTPAEVRVWFRFPQAAILDLPPP